MVSREVTWVVPTRVQVATMTLIQFALRSGCQHLGPFHLWNLELRLAVCLPQREGNQQGGKPEPQRHSLLALAKVQVRRRPRKPPPPGGCSECGVRAIT
jgi:hypothetical protein